MSETQEVIHRTEPHPTYKAKVGKDAQGRVAWEVTVEGVESVLALGSGLSAALKVVQRTVEELGG